MRSCFPSRGGYSPKTALLVVKLAPYPKTLCHQLCKQCFREAQKKHIGLKNVSKVEVDRLVAEVSWKPFPS